MYVLINKLIFNNKKQPQPNRTLFSCINQIFIMFYFHNFLSMYCLDRRRRGPTGRARGAEEEEEDEKEKEKVIAR